MVGFKIDMKNSCKNYTQFSKLGNIAAHFTSLFKNLP